MVPIAISSAYRLWNFGRILALPEPHPLRGNASGRRLVVQDSGQPRLHVPGVQLAPSGAGVFGDEVGEGRIPWPHLTDAGVTTLGPTEHVPLPPGIEDGIAGVELDPWVDDSEYRKPVVRQPVQHPGGIRKVRVFLLNTR